MAELLSVVSAQSAVNSCTVHFGEELDSFCEDCQVSICELCVKYDHCTHQWSRIRKIARQKRQMAPKKAREIRDNVITQLQVNLAEVQEVMRYNEDNRCVKTDEILQRRDELLLEVNNMASILVHLCEIKEAGEKSVLTKHESGIKEKIEHMEKTAHFLENETGIVSNFVLLDMCSNIDKEIEHLTLTDPSGLVDRTKFRVGSGDLQKGIETLFGTITDSSEKLFTKSETSELLEPEGQSASLGNGNILSICPVAEDKAWTHGANSTENSLISGNGEEVRMIDLKVRFLGFVVLQNGDHVLGDVDEKSIKKITEAGDVEEIMSTSPLLPLGICTSTDDEKRLLVCLVDELSYSTSKSSRRIVQSISLTGNIIETYEYKVQKSTLFRKSKKRRLFTKPKRLTQNWNSDICVANSTSDITAEVCVIGADGSYKFTYNGGHLRGHKFYATGICCDSQCNIIVSDAYNHTVHIVQANGQFLKYLNIEGDEIIQFPSCLAMSGNRLWIGNMTGKIQVIDYANTLSDTLYLRQ